MKEITFLKKIKHSDLMSEKHKKSVCKTLNYSENFLVFVSAVSGCISTSAFASLVVVPIDIGSSALRLKNCAITARIKKGKSTINKQRKET